MDLKNEHCEACRIDAPKLTDSEQKELLVLIPDWDIIHEDNVPHLKFIFTFQNYQSALDFTYQVGKLAEIEQHHPSLLTEWGKVTVQWWSHKIAGLHKNDFIMASKTQHLFDEFTQGNEENS